MVSRRLVTPDSVSSFDRLSRCFWALASASGFSKTLIAAAIALDLATAIWSLGGKTFPGKLLCVAGVDSAGERCESGASISCNALYFES